MSNETSRVEAAAQAMWNSTEPPIKWEDSGRLGRSIATAQVTAALAAADADDLANGIRRVRVDEEARFAHIKVVDGFLTSFPVVERVYGGWQSGVMFYPDSLVEKVTPLHLIPSTEGDPNVPPRNVR